MAFIDLNFNQLSTVLNDIVQLATGQKSNVPVNSSEFVSVAQKALLSGYDPLGTAISQVLSRTIYANRPYYAKFRGLQMDSLRFGNHVRKLSLADKEWKDDKAFDLRDGRAVDMYEVSKPKAIQLNYYGVNTYERWDTIYRDQLRNAFTNENELAYFLDMVTQNAQNMIEQATENTARATVCNLIAGTVAGGEPVQKVHLISEYCGYIGEDPATYNVYEPGNFPMFARWLFGRIKTLSQYLTERSIVFHKNTDDGDVARHSPVQDQRLYIFTPDINTIDATVLSNTFNDEYLRLLPYEGVNFWQSIVEPKRINVEAAYLDRDGSVKSAALDSDKVLGVLMDREAAGMTLVNESVEPTPYNARGRYFNIFYNFGWRYLNDFTENCVVLMLD